MMKTFRERWKAYFSGLLQEDIRGENEDQLDNDVQSEEGER